MHDYTNTTTVVTGASKGLGEAYARELASRGAHLVLVARSSDALNTLAGQLRKAHSVRVDVIAADLSDRRAAQTVADTVEELGLEADLLVNNAGTGSVGPFLGRPLEPNLRSVDVNVTALVALCHLLGARMVERGRGGIVNVASTAAFQPMPYQAGYAATKAFVLSFTEALAEEVRHTGVRVMAAHPGAIDTGFFDGTTASVDPRAADTPARIAAGTLDDFARGRSVSYPGRAFNRAGTWASRLLPRTTVVRITGGLNRKLGFDDVRDLAPGLDSAAS
ncbi:SDR family NAD(P)-dependent oxidoreductase [Streptomyces armeniacus]|uniref:SDR family NAD(P)-dependent oxidoreductase n=1 Tax=Streptomyces armeniacus TaxID=83291 RepID=A0A345XTX9_9ACTN|nr:SDR family oxidoreductase [Streptomyces armeniacus]AXK35095.1 SDR family NAD(P)-dependent oxidoreductase [Streptomyces armeniacus]